MVLSVHIGLKAAGPFRQGNQETVLKTTKVPHGKPRRISLGSLPCLFVKIVSEQPLKFTQ
jgi:hypothetical protein